MKHRILPFCLLASVIAAPLAAQTYTVGDIVDDYSFTDYNSGETVSLYELGSEGGVLVLEWFAWWCPFCARAAANVEDGIIGHYADTNGNPDGLPVRHIGLNVQGNARSQSNNFIIRYGFTTVMEDYQRDFFNLFSPGGGQPLFVVINAEPDSPTADQWEVLYTRLNYAGNEAPDISALMRPVIDAVEAGVATDPFTDAFPEIAMIEDTWYQSDWFGLFNKVAFPVVYHPAMGFIHVHAETEGRIYIHTQDMGWVLTGPVTFPYAYAFESGEWKDLSGN